MKYSNWILLCPATPANKNFMKSLFLPFALSAWLLVSPASAQNTLPVNDALRKLVQSRIEENYAHLEELYKDLHAHPELSFHEEKTAARIAGELKSLGLEVATKVGGHGVVGVLRNGAGPTILLRTDLDALPVKEQTALPYASKV